MRKLWGHVCVCDCVWIQKTYVIIQHNTCTYDVHIVSAESEMRAEARGQDGVVVTSLIRANVQWSISESHRSQCFAESSTRLQRALQRISTHRAVNTWRGAAHCSRHTNTQCRSAHRCQRTIQRRGVTPGRRHSIRRETRQCRLPDNRRHHVILLHGTSQHQRSSSSPAMTQNHRELRRTTETWNSHCPAESTLATCCQHGNAPLWSSFDSGLRFYVRFNIK